MESTRPILNPLFELTRIVQKVSQLRSPGEQVRTIVDSISESLQQDVCSLYRIDGRGQAELLSSHGLVTQGHTALPPGKGLIGHVARTRHAINIANASSHPEFYAVENSNEELFKNFCGVPLVRSGTVIGVLTVQSKQARVLDPEREAFLVTLASQLAMLVSDLPSNNVILASRNSVVNGAVGAPGLAIGFAHLCAGPKIANVPDGECQNIDQEIESLHRLLKRCTEELVRDKEFLGEQIPEAVGRIFEAYSMMLADKTYIEKIESEIKAGKWLPGALRAATEFYSKKLKAIGDPYLRSRHEDIEHLGEKLLEILAEGKGKDNFMLNEGGSIILVGSNVSVSEIARVPKGKLGGIVCSEGTTLSHSAVLARALGIPALMGVRNISVIKSGERLIVDCNEGQLIINPGTKVTAEYEQLLIKGRKHRQELTSLRNQEAITIDGNKITLMVNTGLLADISPGLDAGAEGVGLYRTEIPFMMRDRFPGEEEQLEFYMTVLAAYDGKPVYMRTLDIGGDKQLPYFPIHHEENPALGWRGIRLTLDVIQLLVTQIRAMMRAAATTRNLYIVLPMVTSIGDIYRFNQVLDDVCLELESEGHAYQRPPIGIMVEVPAAISQLKIFSAHIDFVSIGSNDLSQYLLALDRNNAKIANRYDHVHPAVLNEIQRILRICKRCELPVSLCGEMAADPTAVVLTIGLGINQLSMSAALLPEIKSLIRRLKFSRAKSLANRCLKMEDAKQIRQLVQKELCRIGYLET